MVEQPIRVILADDHLVVRAGIRKILEHADNIEVVAEADNGETAIVLVKEHHPDVAVLDVQMPRSNGIEAARWIRANFKDIGVLMLTAYDDAPYIMAVLQAGANGYVLKTAPPEELIQAVRSVYEGKSALDATITQKLIASAFRSQKISQIEALTDREMEVLTLVAKGYTNKAIGVHLNISDRTVQGHLAHIFSKLQATSRTEAVMRAVSLGWISHDLGTISEE